MMNSMVFFVFFKSLLVHIPLLGLLQWLFHRFEHNFSSFKTESTNFKVCNVLSFQVFSQTSIQHVRYGTVSAQWRTWSVFRMSLVFTQHSSAPCCLWARILCVRFPVRACGLLIHLETCSQLPFQFPHHRFPHKRWTAVSEVSVPPSAKWFFRNLDMAHIKQKL